MKNRLSFFVKIVSLICAIGLGIVLIVPMWRIDLVAPQYPEGLVLKIHPNKLSGDVDIINGLNHYIGMKKMHSEDFIEFKLLPYLIGFFAAFGLLVVITRKRFLLYTWTILYILFGIVAMVDFYQWEYNYGHNLDPTAAIIVPGMAYQPPLIGFKQLLNFGAYSFPDIGGYIFIIVGLILLVLSWMEWRKAKKIRKALNTVIGLIGLLLIQSCSKGPQPIAFGKEACYFCKMVISDKRFGAELITKKQKIYKFDDAHCIASFLKSNYLSNEQIAEVYLVDYAQNGQLIQAEQSFLLKSEELRSPMGGNVAAFASTDSLLKLQAMLHGEQIRWQEWLQQ